MRKKKPDYQQAARTEEHQRAVIERRRSSASGYHGSKPGRSNLKRQAIEESEEWFDDDED